MSQPMTNNQAYKNMVEAMSAFARQRSQENGTSVEHEAINLIHRFILHQRQSSEDTKRAPDKHITAKEADVIAEVSDNAEGTPTESSTEEAQPLGLHNGLEEEANINEDEVSVSALQNHVQSLRSELDLLKAKLQQLVEQAATDNLSVTKSGNVAYATPLPSRARARSQKQSHRCRPVVTFADEAFVAQDKTQEQVHGQQPLGYSLLTTRHTNSGVEQQVKDFFMRMLYLLPVLLAVMADNRFKSKDKVILLISIVVHNMIVPVVDNMIY